MQMQKLDDIGIDQCTLRILRKKEKPQDWPGGIITLSQWWEVSQQELTTLLQLLENMAKWASIWF